MIRPLIALMFAGVVFASPMTANAAPPRDEAAVRLDLSRRFIEAIQGEQMAASLGQMANSFRPPQAGLSAEEAAAVDRAMIVAMEQGLPRMFDAVAPVYAEIFTLEELTALVSFYESEVGRSLMAKSAAATPRMTEVVMAAMPEVMREMADGMCKELSCSASERSAINASIAAAGFGPAPAPTARPK